MLHGTVAQEVCEADSSAPAPPLTRSLTQWHPAEAQSRHAPPPSLAFVRAAIDQLGEVGALASEGPVSMQALQDAVSATSALLSSLPLDPSARSDGFEGPDSPAGGAAVERERIAVAAALRSTLGNIAAAAERTAQVGGPPIVITSSGLNISVQRLPVVADGGNVSLAQPILASVASGDTEAAVQMPAGLLESVAGGAHGSSEPVGLIMWSSGLDLHGTGSTKHRELIGPTVSVSLTQGGRPLEVNGTEPILINMPMFASAAERIHSATGAARPCIGRPTAESLFARAEDGDDAPCDDVVECNYWDEAGATWSSDGCETVTTETGGMACSCTHLTDFISVQMPSSFEGEIEFANLDLASNNTLQCACNVGVQATLTKTAVGPTPRPVSIDFIGIAEDGDVAWRLLDVVHQTTNVNWVELGMLNGTRTDPISLNMSAGGLAEMGGDLKYQATLMVELMDESFGVRTVTVPMEADISATVVASASTWGSVSAGEACNRSDHTPIQIELDEERDVFFTACDVDYLPVAHELPTENDRRTFEAFLHRPGMNNATNERVSMPVVGVSGASYKATVVVTQGIGLHHLTADLGGESLPLPMPVFVTCPAPLVPYNNNRSCSCPAGYEAVVEGSRECSMCPEGKFQSHPTGLPCQECPPGSAQKDMGSHSCDACDPNMHQKRSGQTRCLDCPLGLSTNGQSGWSECTSCENGQFNRFPNLAAGSGTCRNCVTLSTCTANTTLLNLNVRPGAWRLSERSATLATCFRDVNVQGNTTSSCLGGRNSSAYCAEGTYGPLCSLCSDTERHVYFSRKRSRCEDCPNPAPEMIAIALSMAALTALLYFVKTQLQQAQALVLRTQARIRTLLNIIGFQSKFKRFIGLYQFMDQISVVFEIAMPRILIELIESPVLRWFRFDLSFLYPGACVGSFATKLILRTAGPLMVILVLVVGSTTRGAWQARGQPDQTIAAGARSGFWAAAPMGLFISFLFAIPASIPIFDSFTCVEFVKDADLYDAGRRDFEAVGYFLAVDYSVACSGPNTVTWFPTGHPRSLEHEHIQSIAYVMFIIWPVGMPLLYYSLVMSSRKALKDRRPTRISRSAYFLHGEYKPEYYYWECVDLLRRLALVGFLRAVTNNSVPISRLVCGAVIGQLFLFAILWARPYRKSVDNLVSAMVHITVVGLLLTGCLIEIHQRARLLDTYVSQAYVSSVILGFESVEDWLALVFFSIPVVTIVTMIAVVVLKLVLAKFPKTMHDKETGDMVKLSLERHQKYHTFLSHIWGTGQDQVAAIKRQLCLLVPGISIFLDVDDLEEISALERYIDETAVILIFLSKGYFRSKNCLREVVATVKKRKPVVLVWEPDPNKGGAPIEVLKEELRSMKDKFVEWSFDATVEECEDYIFRESQLDGRPTVPWVRIYDFQLKSLSMIAQTVLTDTPAYIPLKASRPLETYVPGEVSVKTLPLKAPLAFYVSPFNPGADAVAKEMLAINGFRSTSKPPAGGDAQELELPEPEGTDPEATQFLLYLNSETFTGEVGKLFGEQVRGLLAAKVPYFMIHENDPSRNGCEFGHFFSTTPQDLIENGIYGPLAITYSWGPHRDVSLGISAKVMIGEAAKGTFKEMVVKTRRGSTSSMLRAPTTNISTLKRSATGTLQRGASSAKLGLAKATTSTTGTLQRGASSAKLGLAKATTRATKVTRVAKADLEAAPVDLAGINVGMGRPATAAAPLGPPPAARARASLSVANVVPISREYVIPEGTDVGIALADGFSPGHRTGFKSAIASRIQPGSLAYELGIPEGGELIEVNGESVEGIGAAASKALVAAASRPLRLRFRQPGPPDLESLIRE